MGLCFVVNLPARACSSLSKVTGLTCSMVSVCERIRGNGLGEDFNIAMDASAFMPGPFAPFR